MDRNFKNEVFSGYQPHPIGTCINCGKKLSIALKMLNPTNGHTLRVFKCECGERTWTASVGGLFCLAAKSGLSPAQLSHIQTTAAISPINPATVIATKHRSTKSIAMTKRE